ncbi:hypothetical protein H6P81_009158 [Aristolochia fimbriata]|uniref:protein-serine/threonine phosphatase n=1 Tax=Aristolochia fimbriata TaxID=158543 RepID=A0AAV7EPL6_ARIFI|nr:hypothetical protein H6P81_009158 [Aristolochia fimbriata]
MIIGVHLGKFATTFISPPTDHFQENVSSRTLSYLRTMKGKKNQGNDSKELHKKRKFGTPVWRPVSTQSISHEGYLVADEKIQSNISSEGVRVPLEKADHVSAHCSDTLNSGNVSEPLSREAVSSEVLVTSLEYNNQTRVSEEKFVEVSTNLNVDKTQTCASESVSEKQGKDENLHEKDLESDDSLIHIAEKHSKSIDVDASLIRFVRGKGGSTQMQIERETGVKIILPTSKDQTLIMVEGASAEAVVKAEEKIQVVLAEAVQSPSLDYSHFISLPLAIHPELVGKLVNFQNSILGIPDSCLEGDLDSNSSGDVSDDAEDSATLLERQVNVAVKLNVQNDTEQVKVKLDIRKDDASKSVGSVLSGKGIDKSIFIKPKTFHLTVLMLKLWNKERVALATEILQRISMKVNEALNGQPLFIRLKGLECMKGSPAKARVVYAPVVEIGGEDRLIRACQVIIDEYVEAGLVLEKDAHQKLKLHATVMNARHRKGKRKNNHRFASFDARGIFKEYGAHDWGELIQIPEEMEESKQEPLHKFLRTRGEMFKCVLVKSGSGRKDLHCWQHVIVKSDEEHPDMPELGKDDKLPVVHCSESESSQALIIGESYQFPSLTRIPTRPAHKIATIASGAREVGSSLLTSCGLIGLSSGQSTLVESCLGHMPFSPRDTKDKGHAHAGTVENAPLSDSSSEQDYDEVNQLSFTRDSDLAISRLSRVSAQFLPPDGSRTVRVPSINYELKYSYLSQRGYYPDALDKANQDSYCIHTPFGTNPNDHFFGVFDGHGEYGAHCSQFVKQKLCENLLKNSRFHVDAVEASNAAFLTTNMQMHADNLDDSMSGTTAITILVRGRTIYVANTGDSRAVIAEKRGKDIVAVDLSIDQTPFRVDELERVKECGARVLTLDQIEGLKNPDVQCWGSEEADDGDPPRLWVPNGMYPGTAFTRSIGDSIAETIGVVATPEIVVFELTPDHPFFVLASDGVFEFLSSQSVVDMVAKYNDPRDACAAIVAESYRLWLQYETRTDDITIIVVHINGLTSRDLQQTSNADVKPVNQALETAGSESPSSVSVYSSKNKHRGRHDLSRARVRAIESSLENGHVWVPPSASHRKTWEEEAHIERALREHFLFRKLTDSQCHVLLDCMQRVDVNPGDIVVQQGGEGDCFYVVGSGEFEVLATQEEKNEEVRVLHRYTAEKLSSFGELALMYNKPLQSSVRAVTSGTLWALKREDFRGILMSEFSNLPSLKLLRSVEILSRLTILQLSHVADSLLELSFSDGQTLIDGNEPIKGLYLIQKGQVRLSYETDLMERRPNLCSLSYDNNKVEDHTQDGNHHSVEKGEGSYFGEWTLIGEDIESLTAVAIGHVVCLVLTKEKFESAIGPLTKLSQDDHKVLDYAWGSPNGCYSDTNFSELKFADLEWRKGVYSTDCCETGLVFIRGSESLLTLKRFSKRKIKQLGKERQVLKEKSLMMSLGRSSCVPQILHTFADKMCAGILLNTCLACPLVSILRMPLDESSARFCAASVVLALEELHKSRVLFRGVSPDVLMLDQTGYLQIVDFRFGKGLLSERTFTITGMADFLAPEVVQGKGHGFAADWWALGVLIYFMLQVEMPFGSWRESELDTFAKIARGQLTLPHTFSPEVVDLITKLLEVDEGTRLGSDGPDSIKSHQWFSCVDWKSIKERNFPVPQEITSRLSHYLPNHAEDLSAFLSLPSDEVPELNTREWLEDW